MARRVVVDDAETGLMAKLTLLGYFVAIGFIAGCEFQRREAERKQLRSRVISLEFDALKTSGALAAPPLFDHQAVPAEREATDAR